MRTNSAVVTGLLGGVSMEMMLDSGSAVSLVRKDMMSSQMTDVVHLPLPLVKLVTAAGDDLLIVDHIQTTVRIQHHNITHSFIVVNTLITPAILGIDFLQQHGITIDFASSPIDISIPPVTDKTALDPCLKSVLEAERAIRTKNCAVISACNAAEDQVEDYAIPVFSNVSSVELPECKMSDLQAVVHEFHHLFKTTPGKTDASYHYIPTTGTPVRVPPRRIPIHYREEVLKQLQSMLDQEIIKRSTSPWMAPAVFIPKKSGEIRLCVDYRALNKKTSRDAYPLPLPDAVQDRLAGSTIFSTLDLRCGYWQVPVWPEDQEKTAFCPGPGMGLYEFCRMPFGLSGAPGSFQRLMDKILHGLSFVVIYLDDILIHSTDARQHADHLRQVFHRLHSAGLTLKGSKCHIGMHSVSYLGHIFSASGMAPDPKKTQAIEQWPTPANVKDVRQFLGLASYYRRYIKNFANIAAPLHEITQKSAQFSWNQECKEAFSILKQCLLQSPILVFPNFSSTAKPFVLQTDASARGIGAVLEQGGQVVAYASRVLTKAERSYSVIQQECLAIVYALKQFRHYLLGCQFTLQTDHAPLQWLSSQKMEGLLCRWALSMQEFDFNIEYRKGSANANADALSRCHGELSIAATLLDTDQADIRLAQQQDKHISKIDEQLRMSSGQPSGNDWKVQPLRRYKQIWPQLLLVKGCVCRRYCPSPMSDVITVPVIPPSLQPKLLHQTHDEPSAGHQGFDKTLNRLQQQAYWVGMASDVNKYCRECLKCQQMKQSLPSKAPLTSIPVGRPWEMIAVDVLQVPMSYQHNKYLLVVQDYFTKWAEAIPMPDQTATRITRELIKIFAVLGMPNILHSDQGQNFESTILRQTLNAFGIVKSHTTAYHPQGDGMVERFNRSLLQLLRSYVEQEADWERYLPLVLFAYRTATHSSTGISPFMLMFGRQPQTNEYAESQAYDVPAYQQQLQSKLAELQGFVETKLVEAAQAQKVHYDNQSRVTKFVKGDLVWLSNPTAGKLSPRWEGGWKVQESKSPVTMKITNGYHYKVVHVNRLRHRIQFQPEEGEDRRGSKDVPWNPPEVEHSIIPADTPERRYPSRNRQPPDRLRF